MAASLPNDSQLRNGLTGQFIKTLWSGLKHPPISYLGDEFKYRAADGSNNVRLRSLEVSGEFTDLAQNIMYPNLQRRVAEEGYLRGIQALRYAGWSNAARP